MSQKTAVDWFNEGQAHFNVSKHREAIEAYDRAIALKPDYLDALYRKSYVLFLLERYEDSSKLAQQVIQIDPKYPLAYSVLGLHALRNGDSEKALELYDKAISLDPTGPNTAKVLLNKANLYNDVLGDSNKAIEIFKEAIKLDPLYEVANINLGIIYTDLGNNEEAIKYYDQCFKIQPSSFSLVLKAESLNRMNKKDEAMKNYTEAYKLLQAGKPGMGLSEANMRFLRGEIRAVTELLSIADESENLCTEISKQKTVGVVQEVVNKLKALQVKKETVTQKIISKDSGASVKDVEDLKLQFQAVYSELQQVKSNVKGLTVQVEQLKHAFDSLKEEVDGKMDDFSKKLDQQLDKQDLTPEDKTKIKEYFGAFIGTFSSIYVTSQVVDSGQVQLDSDNSVATVLSLVASFAPFVGSVLSSGVKSLGDFLKAKEIKENARKIKRIANDPTELSQTVGKAAFEMGSNTQKQQQIIKTTEEDLQETSNSRFAQIAKFCKSLEEKADAYLYGSLYRSVAARVGHEDANMLIGEVINDNLTPYNVSGQLVKILTDKLTQGNKQESSAAEKTVPAAGRSSCCSLF